jgi:hypothetical protein
MIGCPEELKRAYKALGEAREAILALERKLCGTQYEVVCPLCVGPGAKHDHVEFKVCDEHVAVDDGTGRCRTCKGLL